MFERLKTKDVQVTNPAFSDGVMIDVPWQHGTVRVHVEQKKYSELPVMKVSYRAKVTPSVVQTATIRVGVMFHTHFASAAEAAMAAETRLYRVYTYKALADLDLTVGDHVLCPIGEVGNPIASYTKVGVVVSLNVPPVAMFMRTITERDPVKI